MSPEPDEQPDQPEQSGDDSDAAPDAGTSEGDEAAATPAAPAEPKAWTHVPPLLLELCDRWVTSTPRVFHDNPKAMPSYLRELPIHVAPEEWGGSGRMREIADGGPVCGLLVPEGTSDALKQVSPQALLRDLFRPVGRFGITDHDFIYTGYKPADMAAFALSLGEAGRLRLRSTLPPPLHASTAFTEEMRRHRGWMFEVWEIPPKPVYDEDTAAAQYDEDGLLKPIQETMG